MIELHKAWVLYQRDFTKLLRNRATIGYCIYAILLTFLTTWNAEQQMVNLATFVIGELGEERQFAFQDAFYDYYFVSYIPIILFVFRPFVLNKVVESHTVSNSLWLRLAPTTPKTLTLYRIAIVLGGSLILLFVSVMWGLVFSLFHGISFRLLIQSFYSLFSYMIFTGGLIVFFKGKPNQKIELRHAFVWLTLLLPILLYFFGETGFRKFGYIYPFTGPYLRHQIGNASLSGMNASMIVGIVLLLIHYLLGHLKSN